MEGNNGDQTPSYTVESIEKDGTLVLKNTEGEVIRYVKEADLAAVKESRISKEDAAKQAETAKATAVSEATGKLDAATNRALQAEAKVATLQEQIAKGGGDAAELVKAQQQLEAAKQSSEALGDKLLELKRDTVIKTYNVPKETVESKNLQDLELFEEALKAVIGSKDKLGNFAVGAGGQGANPLQGLSPHQLAVEAYSQSK